MINFRDKTGLRVGRLVVMGRAPERQRWIVRCDCGTEKTVHGTQLRANDTLSCGCLKREMNPAKLAKFRETAGPSQFMGARTHGMKYTPEYSIWRDMVSRCENPKVRSFKHYGGRGITVCATWRHSFLAFFRDMGSRPSPELSIDRIDVNGNYEPGNCRWATAKVQANNKRNSRRAA